MTRRDSGHDIEGYAGRSPARTLISIEEHDRRYRRRIATFAPIVAFAHLVLFIALERVNVLEDIVMIGYQGPEQLRPEISIVDDRPPSAATSADPSVMHVENVFIEGQDRPERRGGIEPMQRPAKQRRETIVVPEIEGDYYFRTYPSHAPVPYRQDYVILRMVTPEYPPLAQANGQEGSVLVEAYIGADGTVNDAFVRNSSGPISFEESSLTAVRQFLFKPVVEAGRPISFWVSFLVRFRLRG